MSTAAVDTDLLAQAVRRISGDTLTPSRKEALERFAETGFPTVRHEDWRYTSLVPAIEVSNLWLRDSDAGWEAQPASDVVSKYAAELATQIDAYWIVIANGIVSKQSLDKLAGHKFRGLHATSIGNSESLQRQLSADDPMTRFNTALLRDVLRITVDSDCGLDKPLALLMVDDASDKVSMSQTRVIIEAAEAVRVEVVEYHASLGKEKHFANSVAELELGRGASVDYVRIQNRNGSHLQVSKLVTRMHRDSSLRHSAFDVGGALIRNDIAIDISEAGASVDLYGLYLASGRQHIDNHTRVDHRVGPAASNEEYRGILSDRARCVFNGKAIVHKGADGTDARQANHNLLLSDKAEIDTKPELEIYADDVKCSHGATVGQLDKTALFYLRSRGLERDEAAQILTRAFAATIVARSTVKAARTHIESLIDGRLVTLVGASS